MKILKKYFNKTGRKILLMLECAPKKQIDINSGIHLNLGCGEQYLQGWVNIDTNENVNADLYSNFFNIDNHFESFSIDTIQMIHSISYLNLWEAELFFKKAFKLLKNEGILILEFPDILKCSRRLLFTNDVESYIEAIRGIYAFDLNQMENKEKYIPYSFGWSGWHIKKVLIKQGFKKIYINYPETHGRRFWRDSRIVAIK